MKKVNFKPQVLLSNPLDYLNDCLAEGDTLEEALNEVLLWEATEQYLHHNYPNYVVSEMETDLDHNVEVELLKLK